MWDADIYNHYYKERSQPSVDLVHRISGKSFKRILDIGCGTGMSTAAIRAVWKDSEIIGVDLSAEMLERARKDMPGITFIQRDCSKSLADLGTFDLIFSNAFLQWISNQEEFMKNSFEMLSAGGKFAAQIPLFNTMSANQCINDSKRVLPESFKSKNVEKCFSYSEKEYYDMISKLSDNICMWVTDYFHEMDNHEAIIQFLSGTALRPYIDGLYGAEQQIFLDEVLYHIEKSYPCQLNGKVLFPFKRLFLIGTK